MTRLRKVWVGVKFVSTLGVRQWFSYLLGSWYPCRLFFLCSAGCHHLGQSQMVASNSCVIQDGGTLESWWEGPLGRPVSLLSVHHDAPESYNTHFGNLLWKGRAVECKGYANWEGQHCNLAMGNVAQKILSVPKFNNSAASPHLKCYAFPEESLEKTSEFTLLSCQSLRAE